MGYSVLSPLCPRHLSFLPEKAVLLVGTYLTAFEISSEDEEFSSTSPSSISSGASQSCLRSRLISFLLLFIQNKVLFQSRLFEECDLTKLCQMVFGDLPKCASKGDQLSDC